MPDKSTVKENKISENDKVEKVNKNQKEAAGMPDMEGHGSVTAELEGVGGGGLIIEEVFAISTFPALSIKLNPRVRCAFGNVSGLSGNPVIRKVIS